MIPAILADFSRDFQCIRSYDFPGVVHITKKYYRLFPEKEQGDETPPQSVPCVVIDRSLRSHDPKFGVFQPLEC